METVKFYRSSMERERNRHKGHFFNADTMRKWRSKISDTCWIAPSLEGESVYFITSEVMHIRGSGPRVYSLRVILPSGSILTVAGPYSSARTCKAELADLLGCKVSNL
jgi:hypothetical protein